MASCAAELLARALGYRVKVVTYLPPGRHGTNDPINSVIIVAACDDPQRLGFTVLHELAHLRAPSRVPAEYLEAYCNRVAAALLMPRQAFLESGRACDWWLPRLQEIWPHASPLAILWRIADLTDGAYVTARIRDEIVRRVSSQHMELPADAAQLEDFVAAEALHADSGWSEIRVGELRLRAWRNGVERVVTLASRTG